MDRKNSYIPITFLPFLLSLNFLKCIFLFNHSYNCSCNKNDFIIDYTELNRILDNSARLSTQNQSHIKMNAVFSYYFKLPFLFVFQNSKDRFG